MVLLQSHPTSFQLQQTSEVVQFLSQLFHDLKQHVYESTLWVCHSRTAQPFSLSLQETRTLLILQIQFHHSRGSLDLQITPETVLVTGDRLDPLDRKNYSEPGFPMSRFQSLIPLSSSIQPRTAIAELSGTTLTVTMMKSYETPRTAKITVGDRSQLLPYAMAVSTESIPASAKSN